MKLIRAADLPEKPLSHAPNIKKKIWIEKGVIPKLTNFSTATFKPGQKAVSHTHPDMYEAFLISSGIALFRVNSQDYQLNKGDVALIELNDEHEVVNNGSEDLVLICFGIEK